MIVGDKWIDENGTEWTITQITEKNGVTSIESAGRPPLPVG